MGGCRCGDCRQAHTDRERGRRQGKKAKVMPLSKDGKPASKPLRYYDYDTYTRDDIRRARGWDD
jgi:hypothetical protein